MRKKSALIVVRKSLRKMAFLEGNNAINVIVVVGGLVSRKYIMTNFGKSIRLESRPMRNWPLSIIAL